MNTDNFLGIFIDESRENLQLLSDKLLELENAPNNVDILNEIFRVAHTFKGMSKTMGFNAIADLTHNLENLLELLRSGKKKVNEKIVNILFQGLDKLETLVDGIIETGKEQECPGVTELVKKLEGLISDNSSEPHEEEQAVYNTEFNSYENLVIKEAVEKGMRPVEITVTIENDCVLPGARCYMVHTLLDKEGEIFKTVPTVEELEGGKFITVEGKKYVVKFFIITSETNENLKEKVLSVSEIERVDVSDVKEEAPKEEQKQEEDKAVETKQHAKVAGHTIRVNAERLDNLVNLVGELVINKTRISQLSREILNSSLSEATNSIENITSEIQEIVMKLRMVQIEQVFSRFPRLVRDISKNLDKDVNFVIKGQEIEIDRTIVDEVADPLVHLIRNALDHGLENKEDRIKSGKKAKGTLQLIASNECDNILIKVIDDGKGIDPEKIFKKAVEKGLVAQSEHKNLTPQEMIDFIFHPGLSTAEVATDLSGRGVGMDVVKTSITSLNGTVNIKSEKGQGTTVTISLPSTMAIIPSMLVEVGDETYALPLNYINEVIEITVDDIKHIQNREIINFRNTVIPIKRLDKILNVADSEGRSQDTLNVILMKSEETIVGLTVSRVLNQQEIVIKNIDKNLSAKDYISGVTTLGNGEIALILNVNTLIK